MSTVPTDPIQYLHLPHDGIVIIRVTGRATHTQSPALRYVFDQTQKAQPPSRYIVDLDQCTTMDSTFMGTLASIGLHQRKHAGKPLIVTNVQDHVRDLLNILGLKYILEIRPGCTNLTRGLTEEPFQAAACPEPSRIERILMMIEAHERLVDIDSRNELQFKGVLKNLRESLTREQERSDP